MESIDFTGLAARAVAGLHEVRACLLASRDGLTLAALPEGGEELARRALDRLETVGRPERGFLVIGDEVWVVSRRGPYLGIVVAAATARAGLLLDRLESTLRAAEEAKLLAGSAGPGRPEIPRRPRTPLHRDRSDMKPPNPLFEEVARVVSVPEKETHRSESSVGEASATTAWPRTFREPEGPSIGGPGSGAEPPSIVRPTPPEPEEPEVVTPEPEPEPEEPQVEAPEPEEPKLVTPEPEPELEEPQEEGPSLEEEPERTASAAEPSPEIAARATAEPEVDTPEPGPVQGFLRRYVLSRSQEPSASAVTPTEERQPIEPGIAAPRSDGEEPAVSTFEPLVDEPTTDQREPHPLDPAAVEPAPEIVAQPDEPEKEDESVPEPEPMNVDSPIPEPRAPTFQEQLEALELSRPSTEIVPEPPPVKSEDATADTRATEAGPAPLPRLGQPHVDVPKATPHYSPPDALLGEMGRVVAGEPSPADIRPPGVSPVDMSGTTAPEIEKQAEKSSETKSKEDSKERGEETEVDPVALAREFSQLFDEPERNS